MEMARCLLFKKKLPKGFWAEAVNTANNLLNIAPTKNLESKTPYEVWYGSKPSVSHLKVFGCIAFANIQKQKEPS